MVEGCYSLQASTLKNAGLFNKGIEAICKWKDGSRIVINCVDIDRLMLSWQGADDKKQYKDYLGFQWHIHRRYLGGNQYYFICPSCNSRRTKVYLSNMLFRCRTCHKLKYKTQRQTRLWRIRTKLERLAHKLSFEFEWGCMELPYKPKGMHLSTFNRLVKRYANLLQLYYALEWQSSPVQMLYAKSRGMI